MADLVPMRQRFVDEYLIDLNATAAAKRAGYSPQTAHQQGYSLLRIPEVQAAIAASQDARAQRTEITQDRVLREIAAIAFADVGEVVVVGEDGKVCIRDLETLHPDARKAISEITQTSTERKETAANGETLQVVEKIHLGVKFHSKTAGLKMLVDHLGMTAAQRVELTGKDGERLNIKPVKDSPVYKVFSEKQPINVDARRYVSAYLKGERDSPDVRLMVRGHHKMQAHGPRLTLRKLLWIEPYPRGGMENDPIMSNLYVARDRQ
jgi:phage terminase small subunit